jgi:hypothetical protein
MKRIWQYIAIAALAVSAAACKPEYPELSQAGLPQASQLDVTISVNQETNYVTFTMNNKGVVPVWIFGDQKIDGKVSKSYSYTVNGISLRFRDEGEYAVEVKAYNANGISQGSLVKTFTLDNTYRDPFDPSPYIKAVSGGTSQTWEWNHTVNGHFGCGPVGDPLGWWQCAAEGKAGFLYDDTMTFDAEGKYTFDPGDGQAYAKHDAEYPIGHALEADDYLFPAELKTSKYTFENNWNDAGIEEIFLVLESGSLLSYVGHKSAVEEPRFQVLETKTSEMKKVLKLMSTVYTPDNADGISYYYEFVPEGSGGGGDEPGPEVDPLDPTDYDVEGEGNFWKGATLDVETWYSGGDWSGGITPDYEITAGNGITVTIPEGVGGSEWMGQTKLKSHVATTAGKEYDFSVTLLADEDMTVTIKLTNDPEAEGDVNSFFYDGQVQLTAGEPLVYRRHNLTQAAPGSNVMLIFDFGRSPVGSTIAASSILFQEHKDGNMWADANLEVETWYSGGDWSGGITPDYEITAGKGIKVTIPEGTGGSEWMGQTKLKSHLATSSEKTYAFGVTLLADEDMTVTIKLTNDPEAEGDVNSFFYDGQVQLTAGEPLVYVKRGITQAASGDNVMLIFDFGRSPVGSVIEASNIILMEQK